MYTIAFVGPIPEDIHDHHVLIIIQSANPDCIFIYLLSIKRVTCDI